MNLDKLSRKDRAALESHVGAGLGLAAAGLIFSVLPDFEFFELVMYGWGSVAVLGMFAAVVILFFVAGPDLSRGKAAVGWLLFAVSAGSAIAVSNVISDYLFSGYSPSIWFSVWTMPLPGCRVLFVFGKLIPFMAAYHLSLALFSAHTGKSVMKASSVLSVSILLLFLSAVITLFRGASDAALLKVVRNLGSVLVAVIVSAAFSARLEDTDNGLTVSLRLYVLFMFWMTVIWYAVFVVGALSSALG
ncbi:MAG: hypothetical protein LBQ79_00180 [Deltaproteobacteria bacterium]|nr:hypothetical protein [Deltaproteobacteria bacterium]